MYKIKWKKNSLLITSFQSVLGKQKQQRGNYLKIITAAYYKNKIIP